MEKKGGGRSVLLVEVASSAAIVKKRLAIEGKNLYNRATKINRAIIKSG